MTQRTGTVMGAETESGYLGPGDAIAEGDTYVLYDFLPPELGETAFDNLLKEVKWNTMMHRGRRPSFLADELG